jgi:hypothetical protein
MSNIIFLEVDREETYAWVTEISQRIRNIFRVVFKDGYENIFYKDVETGRWMEEDLGYTILAQEVGNQISHFMFSPIHVPKLLIWHTDIIQNKYFRFGFISHIHGEHTMYEIFNAEKKFLYTLAENNNDGDWQILSNRPSQITEKDRKFIEQVIQALPQYAENA